MIFAAVFILAALLSFFLQVTVHHQSGSGSRAPRYVALAITLLPFLAAAVYQAVVQPSTFLFDWKGNALLCLLLAGAVLLGSLIAWYVIAKQKQNS